MIYRARMVTAKIKQLQALQAKANELQKSIEAERAQELSQLPAHYGYDSLPAFVEALKNAAGSRRGRPPKSRTAAKRGRRGRRGRPARRGRPPGRPAKTARAATKTAKAAKPGRRRKRAKITPEVKAQVKAGVEAGKTGSAIAKEAGISLPSVQNIKKELGLVKSRG